MLSRRFFLEGFLEGVLQWVLEGGKVLRRVLRRGSKKGLSRKALRRRKHAFSRVRPRSQKDPSVLKTVRRPNPQYFATAVVFSQICTAFLPLFERGEKTPKPPRFQPY